MRRFLAAPCSLVSLSLLYAVLGSSCGDSGASSADPTTDGGAEAAPGEARGVITPSEGGVVTSADGRVVLEFPPGAVDQDTTISITPSADPPTDGRIVPGSFYTFAPPGLVFGAPVAFALSYGDLSVPAGLDATALRIHKVTADGWTLAGGATNDASAKVARAELRGFSTYGLRALEAPGDGGTSPELPEGELFAQDASPYAITQAVVHDDGHLYWSSVDSEGGGTILRKPLAGGPVETIVSGQSPIFGLAALGDTLFFTNEHVLRSVSTAGGAVTAHASPYYMQSLSDLVVDATGLYWPGRYQPILRVSLTKSCAVQSFDNDSCDTCEAADPPMPGLDCVEQGSTSTGVCCVPPEAFVRWDEVIDDSTGAGHVVVRDGYAYWAMSDTTQTRVYRKPVSGGAVEPLATVPLASEVDGRAGRPSLAVAGGRVYWVQAGTSTGASDFEILSVPVTGGTPQKVARTVSRLMADETHLYFLTEVSASAREVVRVPLGGGAVERLAKSPLLSANPIAGATQPPCMALSASHVYWCTMSTRFNQTVDIRRTPKRPAP